MPTSMSMVETVVRSMARTAADSEEYFCQLDSVVGDGDFGFSLARGFEKVMEEFNSIDRKDPGTFLKKVGLIITSRCGGTSGPLWGTGFLRAGMAVGNRIDLTATDAVAMLRAAFEGIQKRGGAELGDKTLLDALAPLIARFEEGLAASAEPHSAFAAAVEAAETAARQTTELVARRGRASYTGERSRGSPDAGAMAVALMARNVSAACLPERAS